MGVIINIDEALKLRTDYNILREPLNEMIKNQQEAWERSNPLDMIYTRSSIDRFQMTYTSSIGFSKAFVETNDYAVGPIFNTVLQPHIVPELSRVPLSLPSKHWKIENSDVPKMMPMRLSNVGMVTL
jgi:hypothetical protein